MNFTSIVATAQAKREELTREADQLEASASTAAGNFSSLIVDDLNEEVRQIYDTQRQLERESQLLKAELAALKQQLGSWSNTTQQLVEGLKHAGDLEHYVAVLSREAAALAKVLTAAAAAEAQTEAAAAGQATEDAGTLEVGSQQDSAAGLAATAATGGGQQAGAAQSSTPQQSEASLDLPVSKRASR
uniref:Biogenesis of lysosome-related organelles complex 1 subunit 1 n=1 Tax=Tetradesmus obliquus TaxID=3088 RepID=A0A383WD39_TETOB|eukprot:jgi/Sobl393_1/15244/SZX75112.1